MRQNGGDWIAAVMESAKGVSPIAPTIAENLERRLRETMSERELTKAEQMRVAKDLVALVRSPAAAGADSED